MLYDKRWDKPQVDAIGSLLMAAADYIDAHGWCRKKPYAADAGACLIGALWEVGTGSYMHVYHAAVSRLLSHLGMCPVLWNDNHCKSGAEASAMLRRAAQEK
jgi:hypothetical protein